MTRFTDIINVSTENVFINMHTLCSNPIECTSKKKSVILKQPLITSGTYYWSN